MKLWPVTGLLIGVLYAGASAMAETALSLYTAEYKTKLAGLSVTLTRTLTEENGRYHLSQGGKKAFMVKLNEDSQFSVKGDQIVGQQFVYQLSGVSNRRREVLFDEEAGTIRSLRKKSGPSTPGHPRCWTDSANRNRCDSSCCSQRHRRSAFPSPSSMGRKSS